MKVDFQTQGSFDNLEKWLNNVSSANPSRALNQIANDGVKRLMDGTPKATGRTASGWTSTITTKGHLSEIAWTNNAHPGQRVNIAKLIDQGHGTGTGGYVPPKPYIKNSMSSVWKKAGDVITKELIK